MGEVFSKEIGIVRAAKHYFATIEGLPSAQVHDIIANEDGERALVRSLSHDAVEVMLLDAKEVRPGQQFELQPYKNQIAVGDFLIGRAVDALCNPIDGKGALPPKNAPIVLERGAGDLARRRPVNKQLETGYALIDIVLPIAKGQRQLLMGPMQSGTEILCQKIIQHQINKNVICIYASIGKPASYVHRVTEALFATGAQEYTTVIASTSDDIAPRNIITPAIAIYTAEFFAEQGKDVLLVLDDLYTHAKYLREIALLEGMLPGRESYPGDIFYQQAHLIERAGSFSSDGSITLLPILQTDIESATDLIMTNIMGTTDGHMKFSSELLAQGVFPSVIEDASVTRVGRHAHSYVQKQLSTTVNTMLADAKQQERFTQFGSQVSKSAQEILLFGGIFRALLNQDQNEQIPVDVQTVLLALVLTSFSTGKDVEFFRKNKKKLTHYIATSKDMNEVRDAVYTESEFSRFLQLLEKKKNAFEKICRE